MFYFWFIPLAICGSLLILGLYLRFRRRAQRASRHEAKSPLDLAQEMERREDAAEREKKKAA